MADAALDQQERLRDALKNVANEITAYAQTNNQTWPFVVLPLFESFAMGHFEHSAAEYIAVNNLVKHEEREAYEIFANQHGEEWVKESHMIRHGNLDLLDQNQENYNPYITQKTDGGFIRDIDRDLYSARTSQSPPMKAYGPTLNMNLDSIAKNALLTEAVLALRNETVLSHIKPFTALPAEEHMDFHTDSEADHPHAFMLTPVHSKVHDASSPIVATLTSTVAWDASMLNLLPATVEGIHCVVKNDCGQNFTYEVSGTLCILFGRRRLA